MNAKTIRSMLRNYLLGLGAVACMTVSAPSLSKASELATASLAGAQIAPGENQYRLTLNDTGTTTVGTFWFAWVPGDNFMSVSPTSIASPAGWVESITKGGPSNGYAIQWKASAASADLNAGNSLSGFNFDSSLTLAQLESASVGNPSDPVLTAFIYSGAPFSDPGVQLAATATPEPAAYGLVVLGFLILISVVRSKTASQN